MPVLGSLWKRVIRSSITIDVRIVFPAPGMPGQNNVCLTVAKAGEKTNVCLAWEGVNEVKGEKSFC
jgi:hypothetical protein